MIYHFSTCGVISEAGSIIYVIKIPVPIPLRNCGYAVHHATAMLHIKLFAELQDTTPKRPFQLVGTEGLVYEYHR